MEVKNIYINNLNELNDIIKYLSINNINHLFIEESLELHIDKYILRFFVEEDLLKIIKDYFNYNQNHNTKPIKIKHPILKKENNHNNNKQINLVLKNNKRLTKKLNRRT